ncbi:MAG: hypothetical protein AAGF12_14415 [Myxococcota bacterium]
MRLPLPVLGSVLLLLAGCEEPDPRFASPEATLDTMMDAYGVLGFTQDEIQERMRVGGRFQLRDEASYRACFAEFGGPQDEGLAGFVFGTVAAGKDQMRIDLQDDRAHVFPNPDRIDRSVVLVRQNGEWKISLEESVPADVRHRLRQDYLRMSQRNRRAGALE